MLYNVIQLALSTGPVLRRATWSGQGCPEGVTWAGPAWLR